MEKRPLKRHPALQDLSRDHHHALIEAHLLRESVDGEEAARPLPVAANRFLQFWEDEASAHFREEEEVLLPIYARHVPPSQDEDVQQMLDDHAWFRDVVFELRRQLDEGDDLEDLLGRISRRLHDHARLEERQIFERMQEVMNKEDLADVKVRSQAFRERWRSPNAIGPPG